MTESFPHFLHCCYEWLVFNCSY